MATIDPVQEYKQALVRLLGGEAVSTVADEMSLSESRLRGIADGSVLS